MAPKVRPPYERFIEKVRINPVTGCWIWTAGKSRKGYGAFSIGKKYILAHRFSYEWHIGPIPEGLTLDHLCRVRHCVNPMHLEPVTIKVNVLRGTGLTAINARVTHCPYGHEYTPANTYVSKTNMRHCRTCSRDRMRAKRAKLKGTNNES